MNIKDIVFADSDTLMKGKIPVKVYADAEAAFKAMADMMAEEIVSNNEKGKKTLFIVPVGPVGQYKYFAERVNKERISLKDVTFINMDEYMQDSKTLISPEDNLSFRKFMAEGCYGLIDKDLIMPESQRIFPSQDNAAFIEDVIARHGGSADVCFGGIGINGHMAFNEPPEPDELVTEAQFVNSTVRVQRISRETRVVNALNEFDGAYYVMPEYCVTVGLRQILGAKKIRLFCFRQWHRSVVRRAVLGTPSITFPASLLQKHKDALIGISREVAEK